MLSDTSFGFAAEVPEAFVLSQLAVELRDGTGYTLVWRVPGEMCTRVPNGVCVCTAVYIVAPVKVRCVVGGASQHSYLQDVVAQPGFRPELARFLRTLYPAV